MRIILTASHLLGEEGDQLCEVDGAGGFCQHVGGIAVRDRLADVGEGSLEENGKKGKMANGPCRTQQLLNWQKKCGYQTDLEVAGGDDAVLVGVHDAKGLLELLNLLLGEVLEDVDLLLGLPAGKRKICLIWKEILWRLIQRVSQKETPIQLRNCHYLLVNNNIQMSGQ